MAVVVVVVEVVVVVVMVVVVVVVAEGACQFGGASAVSRATWNHTASVAAVRHVFSSYPMGCPLATLS